MKLDPELLEELALLKRFSMSGANEIKLADSSEPAVISAAKRLFAKGLVSASDGGKLTASGGVACEHMNNLFEILSPPLEPI